MIARLANRFGWRGLWLILLGIVWFVFGIGILLEPIEPRSWVLYEQLPAAVQAAGWWLTGLVAIYQGSRGPHRDDSPGHVALYLMPALRLLSFVIAWLVYLGSLLGEQIGVTHTVVGYSQGWFAALIWCLVSAMLAVAAAWPNPTPPLPAPPASTTSGD